MRDIRAEMAQPAEAIKNDSWNDGLDALIHFARQASGADVVLALEAGTDGLAKPLAASPGYEFSPFDLLAMAMHQTDWSDGPVAADLLSLPGCILALERPARHVWFLPASAPNAPNSGILFLWLSDPSAVCENAFGFAIREQLAMLTPVFAQMLNDRGIFLKQRRAAQRFEDLLGNVVNGVVIIEGDGQSGLINQRMAALLELEAGERSAGELAEAMRRLRESCVNSDFLAGLYRPLQYNLDRDVQVVWDLGEIKMAVDTHPILGSGRNGRIWLFHDVTAQHIVDENLRQTALTDTLTGLSNRRHFFSAGEALLAVTGGPEPAVVLMLDIEDFKTINDRYGRPVGDDVLREVSARLKAVLRHEDLLARVAGKDFAALLTGLSDAGVIDLAERLRLSVAAAPIMAGVAQIEVQVRIGVAQRRGVESLEAVLQRADKALNAAKSVSGAMAGDFVTPMLAR